MVSPISGRGRLLRKPRLSCLEECPCAFDLAPGVRWFNFFFERVIADLPLFEGFNQMLVEHWVKRFGFREVLAEGSDDGAMLGERQSLAQQQGFSEVEHRVVGARYGKSVQSLLSQKLSRFDALPGAFQDVDVLSFHGRGIPSLSERHAFAPNVHQQRGAAAMPLTLSDGNDANDATVLQRQSSDQSGKRAEFFPGRGEIIQHQGDINVRTFNRFSSRLRSEQRHAFHAVAVVRAEPATQFPDDGLKFSRHSYVFSTRGHHTSLLFGKQWNRPKPSG